MTALRSPIPNLEPAESFRFYEVDFGDQDETESLVKQKPLNQQDQKERDNNPFGAEQSHGAHSRHKGGLTLRERPFLGQKRSCLARTSPFIRILIEQFDASVLLLPGIFYKLGFTAATI